MNCPHCKVQMKYTPPRPAHPMVREWWRCPRCGYVVDGEYDPR